MNLAENILAFHHYDIEILLSIEWTSKQQIIPRSEFETL